MNGRWGTRHISRNTEELQNTDYPTHPFHKGMWLPCLFYKGSNIPIYSSSGLSSHVFPLKPLGCLLPSASLPPSLPCLLFPPRLIPWLISNTLVHFCPLHPRRNLQMSIWMASSLHFHSWVSSTLFWEVLVPFKFLGRIFLSISQVKHGDGRVWSDLPQTQISSPLLSPWCSRHGCASPSLNTRI